MNPLSWNISWRLDSEWGVSPAASLPQELLVPIFCSIFSTKAKSLPSPLPLTTLWWHNTASCPSAPVLPVGEQFELPTKPPVPISTGKSLALQPLSLHSAVSSQCFSSWVSSTPSSRGTLSSISSADFLAMALCGAADGAADLSWDAELPTQVHLHPLLLHLFRFGT